MAPKTPTVDITVVTKNLRALHGALEHSLTIQRNRLQEIVDDLVSRGTLSRADADGLIGQLLASSKDYSQALLQVLDSVTADARRGLGAGIAPVRATAGKLAETARKAPALAAKTARRAEKAAPEPLAKPAAKVAEMIEPIPGYAELTVAQIRPRLDGLSASALLTVREIEADGKARKSVLERIDQLLGPKG